MGLILSDPQRRDNEARVAVNGYCIALILTDIDVM